MNGKPIKIACLLLFFAGIITAGFGQPVDRISNLKNSLDSLSRIIPGLNQRSDLALSNVPLHDYLRSLGKVHKVNLYVDDYPDIIVTNNFVNEPVKSIFLFLCKKFELTIEPVGTILNFIPYQPPVKETPPVKVKEPSMSWKEEKVSFDLKDDSLSKIVRKLSRMTGETLILRPGGKEIISGFIPPSEFEDGLGNLLFMNGYNMTRHRKGFYVIEPAVVSANGGRVSRPTNNGAAGSPAMGLSAFSLDIARDTADNPLVFLYAEKEPIDRVIRDLFAGLEMEYHLMEELEGEVTLNLEGAKVEEVLSHTFRGSEYSFRENDGVFVIGKRDEEGLRQTTVIRLKYRPTEKVSELIPAKMKEGLEIIEFAELNRFIVSGASEKIIELQRLIAEIDRPVPMVKVEMVMVEVNFSRLLSTGIKAGLLTGNDTLTAVKSLFPGLDYSLDGSEINTILGNSGIPGLMNLGALKSNFYLQLKALEETGNGRVVTRPVISTLNNKEASITIGQTLTFRLETNTFNNGAVNAYNQTTARFEQVQINTTINVKPYVSQDGMITLEVTPDFTVPIGSSAEGVPPTIETRRFESTIRVRDGETVVLGGLDSEIESSTTKGLPFLGRVPVLKWIFGNNDRTKKKSSLIMYITPTVEYN